MKYGNCGLKRISRYQIAILVVFTKPNSYYEKYQTHQTNLFEMVYRVKFRVGNCIIFHESDL